MRVWFDVNEQGSVASSEHCLERHLLVEFQRQSLVWTQEWRVLPGRSFLEKAATICVR